MRRVTFSEGDRAFQELLAETRGKCFVYVFAARGHTLRVGKNAARSTRLWHHLKHGYGRVPGYAHYRDFFRALVGEAVTITWIECDSFDVKSVEDGLRRGLDPLWEQLMRERRMGRRVDFHKPVRAILRGG